MTRNTGPGIGCALLVLGIFALLGFVAAAWVQVVMGPL